MDLRKAIFEFVIATIPAVILFFGGWVYLNYFLAAFGISISELSIDMQTTLIYSFSPMSVLFYGHWKELLVLLGIVALIVFIDGWFGFATFRQVGRYASPLASMAMALPTVLQLAAILIGTMLVFLLIITPAIRWSAERVADRFWTSTGVRIDPIVKAEDAKGRNSKWHSNLQGCADRRALELIYSDQSAYYVLCKSPAAPGIGIVFEIRRNGGLASIRYAERGRR